MGIRAVRIYTIHRPDFYTELLAYNTLHPDAPLYLMQGVYPPDESYVTTQNVFGPAPTKAFDAELRDAVAAVTGKLSREPVRGHADGHWTADVSAYVMGWIMRRGDGPGRGAGLRRAQCPATGLQRHLLRQHRAGLTHRTMAGCPAGRRGWRADKDRDAGTPGVRQLAAHGPAAPPE